MPELLCSSLSPALPPLAAENAPDGGKWPRFEPRGGVDVCGLVLDKVA